MRRRIFEKFTRSTTMFRIFISILSISAVSVILLSICIYYIFQNKSLSAIEKANRLTLFNIDTTITNYFDSARRIAMELYQSNEIKRLMLENDATWNSNMQKAFNRVNSTISVNSSISSIYIMSGSQMLIKCSKVSMPQVYLDGFFNLVKSNTPYQPVPWVLETVNKEKFNIATIFCKEATLYKDDFIGAIMVNMDVDILHKSIFSDQTSDLLIYVVDNSGRILLHNDMACFADQIPPELHFENIVIPGHDNGSTRMQSNGKNYQLSYLLSSSNNYYVLSLMEYDLNILDLIETRNMIIAVCVFVLVVLVAISIIASYRIYRPISNIFFSIRNLFSSTDQSQSGLNEIQHVSNVITRIVDTINNYEKEKERTVIKNYFQQTENPGSSELEEIIKLIDPEEQQVLYFRNIVLRICNYKDFVKNNTSQAINIQMDSMGTIASNIIAAEELSTSYFTFDDHILLVAKSDRDPSGLNVGKTLVNVQNTIMRLLGLEVTIGISRMCDDIHKIKALYAEALELTDYRLLHGKRSVIDASMVSQQKEESLYASLDAVLTAVLENSRQTFENAFDEMIIKCRQLKLNYHTFTGILYNLASAMLKIPKNAGISENDTENFNAIDIINHLNEMEDSGEIKTWLLGIFDSIALLLSEINHNRTHFIISSALDYIERNYKNPDITASSMADILSISSSYFSRIFNEHVGKSFREYLINIRLEKAREILIAGNEPKIKEICEQVGYGSTSYFISEFKKKYGITPLNYRLNNLISTSDRRET